MDEQTKPSRSDDDIVSAEEQHKMSQLVREHFSSLAPKRPFKPTRSDPPLDEHAHLSQEHLHAYDSHSVECATLKHLMEANVSQGVCESETAVLGDEYLENDYYKDLNAVDRIQHHTTGSGFIKVEKGGDKVCFNLEDDSPCGQVFPHSCKCNPATNDWIPSPNTVFPPSQKPPRSDP